MIRALIIFMFFSCSVFAQLNMDSLVNLLKSAKADTNKLNLLMEIVQWEGDNKVWPKYNNEALALSKILSKSKNAAISLSAKRTLSQALNNQGFIELNNSRFVEANASFLEALELKKATNDQNGIITTYCNLGAVMDKLGKLDKALEYYFLAIKIKPNENDFERTSYMYGNIGNIYHTLLQDEKALVYFKKAIEVLEKSKSGTAKSHAYTNIAAIYNTLKQHKLSISSSYKALDFALQEHDIDQELMCYTRLASAYSSISQFDSSLYFSNLCVEKNKTFGNIDYSTIPLYHIAYVQIQQKKYMEAEKNLLRCFQIRDSLNNIDGKQSSAQLLTVLYDSLNDYKNELKYYKISTALSNSLSKDEYKAAAIKQELQYDYFKKENELLINQIKNEKEIERHKLVRLGFIIGSGLLLILVFFIVKSLLSTKKAQKLLAAQKQEVEIQKAIIETKQLEIISSINYAKRIQAAVLTGEETWKKISKNYFILYKPKDIVSGDFYWAHVLPNGRAVFALADCTGHGVPGGFMSMLGNSFLNEIVVENKIFSAAAILNRLREKIISALEQKGQAVQKDGMDIGLCVWNKMDNTLEFAGANNSLYLVRENKLLEFKGNKMPIGTHITDSNAFTSQFIQLQKNDSLYITTDGFPDQFGGPRGKKYKYAQLETVILAIQDLEMEQQREILEKDIEGWKGSLEQVDDIGLIGIRV